MNNIVSKGKHLAWLLRHDKASREKGFIDEHGYRKISEIIQNYGFTMDEIKEIVITNNKQRFEYNNTKTKIRARQGHSIDVMVDLTEVTNCEVLYHGTSSRFIKRILEEGLKKQSRNYAHLSYDIKTASDVGKRHGGDLCIIKIDAKQMINDGNKIYISNNGVYLTEYVNPKYMVIINGEK